MIYVRWGVESVHLVRDDENIEGFESERDLQNFEINLSSRGHLHKN